MQATAVILIAISSYWMIDSLVFSATELGLLEIITGDLSFRLESLVSVIYNGALAAFVYQVYRRVGQLGT